MQTYSMVFLDIDGTLIDSSHQVSPRTRALLEKLEKKESPSSCAPPAPLPGLSWCRDRRACMGQWYAITAV